MAKCEAEWLPFQTGVVKKGAVEKAGNDSWIPRLFR